MNVKSTNAPIKKKSKFIPYLLLLSTILFFQYSWSQNISVKIIDATTKEVIPYATINIDKKEHLISNAEGFFNLPETALQDDNTLIITYLGYKNLEVKVSQLSKLDYIIALTPTIFELDAVQVNGEKPNPYSIMATVKANLAVNYGSKNSPTKDMLFVRKSTATYPNEIVVDVNQSTGFSKQALKKVNNDIQSFTNTLIASPPKEYTDMLCNLYTNTIKKDNKSFESHKMNVLKATVLKNEGSATSSEELKQIGIKTMLKHLDSTKYYRIKSGLIGSRDTISLRKDFNKKKIKSKSADKSTLLTTTKYNLTQFIQNNNLGTSSEHDFINNPDLYRYKFEGTTFTEDNDYAFVLTFSPKKSKAKYTGKLYINESDYAVLRAEYQLDEGEKLNNVNLKWLLGIKVAQNNNKGILMYRKKSDEKNYYLHYASEENGNYFYVNRPLKFIEITKEDKDILSLDIKFEGNATTKTEFLNLSHSLVTDTDVTKVVENEFKLIAIKSYDPKIWKGYHAIEPLAELKRFRVKD
ncbi:carboxypeptidase-like regulatory domain-containing protein [Flavobacterium sp. SOK18b]|uniref:carboxypeptidase-like regulatory domain-containing protein n=1 Tax=Flavobacterium sp. SOK18b TaxID=797900 RepID=UPI0015FD7847|nr:carboxypeptidase-like regulatory domain-containing protein [Flavobacterium sp. SOK18b]MBB1194441.1 carboxypeptidase-like regulatory domain-containing protein [Flavobacterium sp. SOK18b]